MRLPEFSGGFAEFKGVDIALIVILVIGLLEGEVRSQINVFEPNLHDGAEVHGLLAPIVEDPFVNFQDISVLALGESDPSLYSNTSFSARGLFSEVNLVNNGFVDVNAIGGVSYVGISGFVGIYVHGIVTDSDANITNAGAVNLDIHGGTHTAAASTDAYLDGWGIDGDGDVNNSGDVTITAISGNAGDSPSGCDVFASIFGVSGRNTANSGNVVVSLEGDICSDPNQSRRIVHSAALGVRADNDVNNTGSVAVSVIGGRGDVGNRSNYTQAFGVSGHNVSNAGTVTVTVDGGEGNTDSAYALSSASGIGAGGSVSNTGDVTVTCVGGDASTSGIYGHGRAYTRVYGVAGRTYVMNSGNVMVAAMTRAVDFGEIYGYGITASSANVQNDGDIAVSVAGVATAGHLDWEMKTVAYGYGIEAESSNVNNDGDIAVTVSAGSFTSSAATTEAYALADGIVSLDGDVYSTGDITVTVRGGNARDTVGASDVSAVGTGLNVSSSIVRNLGDILVKAYGGVCSSTGTEDGAVIGSADGCGIRANGPGQSIFNSGAITVVAGGGIADSYGIDALATTAAYGIYASLADVENFGPIDVNATGGMASASYGIAEMTASGYGIYGRGSHVTNSADIAIVASSEDGISANAYGIYLESGGSVTNTGIIRTSGPAAYEVYVASGTASLVDTYNVTLDGSPSDEPFGVANGATLDLNGATLTVTDVAGETIWDREYQLFEAVGSGAVDGSFSDVEAVNPDALARYHMQGTANAADDTVSLSYKPEASETKGSAAVEKQLVTQSMGVVHHRMTSTLLKSILYPGNQGLLVDAGPLDKSLDLANSEGRQSYSGAFIEPYYSRMDQEADPLGHDARLWGFAAGYERQMNSTVASIHAGYGRANVDYTGEGYSANGEEQDILTGGLAAVTRWGNWTVRYGVTGFYGWHEYHGLTGAGLTETETASIDSYGVVATGMLGHVLRRGSHVILPEVGFNYLWGHRKRYTTDASDPAWDTTFSAMDDHDVEAEAALHWMTGFMHKDIHVTPSVSVGVRHLLTDDESIVHQSIPGIAPVSVKSERDRTAVTASGSVTLTKSNHTLSLAYDGEYSNDTARHSLWLRYGWQF